MFVDWMDKWLIKWMSIYIYVKGVFRFDLVLFLNFKENL